MFMMSFSYIHVQFGVAAVLLVRFREKRLLEVFLEDHRERWHIAVGIQYNRWLWNRWKGVLEPEEQIPFMLASYNCGRGRLLSASYMCGGCLQWAQVRHFAPPITRHYLVKVFALMGRVPH